MNLRDDTLARWLAQDGALRARIPPESARGRLYATLLDSCRGRVLHGGRQVATAEGRLVGPDGKLYAHGTTPCLVFEVPT
jgi:hypothetical protein